MSVLDRIVALAKANPAAAIAGTGVAGVLILPAIMRSRTPAPSEDPEQAQQEVGPNYGPGYGAGLIGPSSTLESDALASQINEGNNFLLGQLGQLREQIALTRSPAPAPAIGGGRGGPYSIRRPLPGTPGTRLRAAKGIGGLREQKRLSDREVSAILLIYGLPRANPPASARRSSVALVRWIRERKGRAGA